MSRASGGVNNMYQLNLGGGGSNRKDLLNQKSTGNYLEFLPNPKTFF